jgi:hypothetical protein
VTFALYPHQIEPLEKLHCGSVLIGGVGSGKSVVALAYFTRISETKKIIVITTAKKRDSGEWWGDAMKMSLRNELVVDSWNNIAKYEDENAFFIFDEQHVVGWGAWTKSFLKITPNNHWILLSATPADTWIDLIPVFVANGFYKNKTEFTDYHVRYARYVKYPKVDGYLDVPTLEHFRSMVYVEMPYLKHTTRETHTINVSFNIFEQKMLHGSRWNIEENKPLRDVGEMMRLLRKSSNSDPSRLEAVKQICADHPRVIIFYNHNYELDILRTLMTELDIPLAEWNGHVHQDIPQTERWIYLVQFQASEGWNCITTDTVIFYSLPYSYRNYEQAQGRIDRLNTQYEVLHYYVLKSSSIIDRAIWKALTRKKNFNASAFAKKVWTKAA